MKSVLYTKYKSGNTKHGLKISGEVWKVELSDGKRVGTVLWVRGELCDVTISSSAA